MSIKLPFAEYDFCFQAVDTLSLPAFADPLWRSVFGLSLRQLSCSNGKRNCTNCPQQSQCDYACLLQPLGLPGKAPGITARMNESSGPLIFHSQLRTYLTPLPPGANFTVRLILIGRANEKLVAIITAMVQAGQLGFGKKRSKFCLVEVLQKDLQELPRIIMNNGRIHTEGRPGFLPVPPSPAVIRCTFVTPYLLPGNIDLEDGFNGVRFIMQVVRRLTSLQNVHTDTMLEADFTQLKMLAGRVGVLDTALTIESGYSYFGKKNKKRFSAVRGALILDLSNCPELWPWLWYGQWLHVPKMPGKGFGRYELAVVKE